ncbi:MAG: aldo/keto reductase family protein [Brevinema sp.]
MKYRRLGKSGLLVSEISLGGWLTYGGETSNDSTYAIIDKAYELGVNFFDCANVYANGASEKIMGEILNRYPRESYVLTTKAFWPMSDLPNGRGLSRKHVFEQVHKSLQRLNVDYVDIFYCHRFDPESDLYETLRTIDDFIRQGKILYMGVSEWAASQIIEGLKIQEDYLLDSIVVNQPVYNLVNRGIEKEVVPTCVNNGIGLVPFSPLAQGFLTGKYKKGAEIPKDSRAANENTQDFISRYLTPQNLDRIQHYIAYADKKGCTPAQLALAWLLHRPGVVSALTGASKVSQLESNIEAINIDLTDQEVLEIEQIFE